MICTKTTPAKLVTFARGGDTVHYSNNARSEGYGSPDRPHAADPDTHNIPDGTVAIDTTKAVETKGGYLWSLLGPAVNVDLEDGKRDLFKHDGNDALVTVGFASVDKQFAAILKVQQLLSEKGIPGPMDRVSVREYAEGWKKHGARVGHYENGRIVWHA